MSGCEVIAPTPRWGVVRPLPWLAGHGISSCGKSACAVSLCRGPGLGRRAAAQPSVAWLQQGRAGASFPKRYLLSEPAQAQKGWG